MPAVNDKPIIRSIPTFDVNTGCTINFSYYGGNFNNILVSFFDNATAIKICEIQQGIHATTVNISSAFLTQHLENGNAYYVTIQLIEIFYEDNEGYYFYSDESDPALCYCFTTPTFQFYPFPIIEDNQYIVTGSYIEAILQYAQIENEPLNIYSFELYQIYLDELQHEQLRLIATSGNLYNTSNLSYLCKNLLNNTKYVLKAYGTTLHKMYCNTEINFTTKYDAPIGYSALKLENNPESGSIIISSDIRGIEGTSYPFPPTYTDNNSAVNVRGTYQGAERYVKFDAGFNIEDAFVLKMVGRNLTPFTNILTMSNGDTTITIEYKIGDFESYTGGTSTYYGRTGKWCGYFELKVSNPLTNYVGISNYINYININQRVSSTNVFIWLKHCDVTNMEVQDEHGNVIGTKTYYNLFEIKAQVL